MKENIAPSPKTNRFEAIQDISKLGALQSPGKGHVPPYKCRSQSKFAPHPMFMAETN